MATIASVDQRYSESQHLAVLMTRPGLAQDRWNKVVGLDFHLKAEADTGADVVLPTHTPALTPLAAVDRFPMREDHHRAGHGILQFDLTTPIRAKG